MHVKFHIDKWVPEVKGGGPGSAAHWQSTFVIDPGPVADLPNILAARRHAVDSARHYNKKGTTKWRVRKVETEVIYERETIQSDTGSAPSDTGAGSRRSRVAAICSPRAKSRMVKRNTPWRIVAQGKGMSAVLDSNDKLVCGSLICAQTNPEIIGYHQLIVEAVNKL